MSAPGFTAGRFAPASAFENPVPTSVREMVAIACKHRWRIVAALLAPPLLALVAVLLWPPSYRAYSDIVVKTGREYMAQGGGESANLTAPTSTKQESINSEIALLTSRAVAETTIAAIGMDRLYPDIVADPPSSGTVLDAAILRFSRDLSVEAVKLSNVVSVSFDAASPAQAREILDTLVRTYIEKHTEVFAGRRADSYRDSVATAMNEVRALEQRRSALKLDAGIFDIETQRKAAIERRVDAESRLEEARSRQARLTARLAFLAKTRSHLPATTLVVSVERSDSSEHASQALLDLQQQEAALRYRVGDANPNLQRLRSELGAARQAVATTRKDRNATTGPSPLRQQLEQEAVMAGADLAMAGTEIDRLAAVVEQRTAELGRMERADVQLRDLGLQIDVVTQNLRAMQGRFEQARADEQTDLARQVSVVQVAAATGSEKPVAPRKLVFGAAGLLAGVLLAGLVATLAILLSTTAVTGEAAERRIGLPVLATLPFHDGGRGRAFGAP